MKKISAKASRLGMASACVAFALCGVLNFADAAPQQQPQAKQNQSRSAASARAAAAQNRSALESRRQEALERQKVFRQNIDQARVGPETNTPASGDQVTRGKKLYKACSVCHGRDGNSVAPGQLEGRSILDYNQASLRRELELYRAGKGDNGGLNEIMIANMHGWTDSEIADVSAYVSTLVQKHQAKKARDAQPKEAQVRPKATTPATRPVTPQNRAVQNRR